MDLKLQSFLGLSQELGKIGQIPPLLHKIPNTPPSRKSALHNKAACALANKLARICYATLRDKTRFGETERLNKKITRESFVMPA